MSTKIPKTTVRKRLCLAEFLLVKTFILPEHLKIMQVNFYPAYLRFVATTIKILIFGFFLLLYMINLIMNEYEKIF